MASPQLRRDDLENVSGRKKDGPATSTFRDHLKLFREQKLEVAGDFYVKGGRFQRSRKYHAELRGCILTVFRNAQVARDECVESVISVMVVPRYQIDILQKDRGAPRIYIKGACDEHANETYLMYIKVTGGKRELDAWRQGLALALKSVIPRREEIRVESVIGRGGGGKVFLVYLEKDPTHNPYALKVITKDHAFKTAKSFRHVAAERALMQQIGHHPFLLQMQFAFQTEENLFIGTPFCPGGDLASYLRSRGDTTFPCGDFEQSRLRVEDQKKRRVYGRLSESQTRLIAAELILAIEHLHKKGIVYRDMKPENVFIDKTGHIKLGDYGLAKNLEKWKAEGDQTRTASVCGTRNYLPPEMLFGRVYSYETDLWSLGIMLFRMLCGVFPFEAPRSKELFYKVKVQEPLLPSGLSRPARKLLDGLLQKDPRKRLKIPDLKRHPFFCDIDWADVFNRRGEPCIPDVNMGTSATDALDNFELSKLEAISLGELVCDKSGNGGEQCSGIPSHNQDISNMMIGFEYGHVQNATADCAPLEVKQVTGGMMRITSNDDDTPIMPRLSPRKSGALLFKVLSLDEGFFKMGSRDDSTRSPRTVLRKACHARGEHSHQR